MATVVRTRDLTDVTRLLVVEAPHVARAARPGQFVILRVSEAGERIPISIADSDPQAGTVTIVVQVVGRTSALVCALEEGDEILDLAGPLGQPVQLPDTGHTVLVGGGFGVGAVHPLAEELRRRGVRVSAIVGARTAELLILRDLLEPVCDEFHVCTDDGSLGYHGLVSTRLQELIERGAGYTSCFAVGPMAMMRAVAEVTRPLRLPTMVSLDPIMVDGTGMCGGCRVTVGGRTRFACVDGPFFDAHEVDYDEALARSQTYRAEERLACELGRVGSEPAGVGR